MTAAPECTVNDRGLLLCLYILDRISGEHRPLVPGLFELCLKRHFGYEYAGRNAVQAAPGPNHKREGAAAMADERHILDDEGLKARFWANVDKSIDGCWLWSSSTQQGYGIFYAHKTRWRSHRLSFIASGRSIPSGMVIDHTCRVRNCVNPQHLRVVTTAQNTLENSVGLSAANAAKTHCKYGHELVESNLVPASLRVGQRQCRKCAYRRKVGADKAARANFKKYRVLSDAERIQIADSTLSARQVSLKHQISERSVRRIVASVFAARARAAVCVNEGD